MYKFIIYSRKSKNAQDGHTQHTHLTAEWQISNYLKQLDDLGVDYEIAGKFEEDISGGGYYTKRPIFTKIVNRCREDKSLTLLVSKADRMARNLRTGSELMETINFILANAPDADDMQKQLEFMIAEREYKNTSTRFKDMYQAKKSRCEKKGEVCEWGANSQKYQQKLAQGKINHVSKHTSSAAAEYWEQHRPQIEHIITMMKNSKTKLTFANICSNLNKMDITSREGKVLSPAQTSRILDKLNISRV